MERRFDGDVDRLVDVRALPERGDDAIASDLGYRWDGVHVYKPGANLVYTAVAPDLLRLAGV